MTFAAAGLAVVLPQALALSLPTAWTLPGPRTWSGPPVLFMVGLPPGGLLATSVAVVLTVVAVSLAVPGPSLRLRRLSRLGDGRADRADRAHWVHGVDGRSGPGDWGGAARVVAPIRELVRGRPDAWPARTRALVGLLTGAGAAGLGLLGGLRADLETGSFGLIAAVICYLVAGRLEPGSARQRRLRMVTDLPHTLELLAAALHAGLPLRAAVAWVGPLIGGPLGDDLARVLHQVDLGIPEADAWRTLRDHPVLGHLALDLARSVDSGTMLAATLRHHARESRRNRRGALEARARSVGVHSVPPLMVCFLPAFLLIGVVPTGVTAFLHSLG